VVSQRMSDYATAPGSARVSPKQSFPTHDFVNSLVGRITRMARPLFLGSAGCQPAAFGSLPNASAVRFSDDATLCWRQAAANCRHTPLRLGAACAPRSRK
jgi:hypothetical protein